MNTQDYHSELANSDIRSDYQYGRRYTRSMFSCTYAYVVYMHILMYVVSILINYLCFVKIWSFSLECGLKVCTGSKFFSVCQADLATSF